MEVVGDGRLVDVAQAAFLRAHTTGEVAEVIDRERNVRRHRLADRLAVVDRLGIGEQFKVLLDAIGDLQQQVRALGRRRAAPAVSRGVRGVQRKLDVFARGARGLGVDLAGDRRDDIEVRALDGCDPLAADEVVVVGLVLNLGTSGAGRGVGHACSRWVIRYKRACPVGDGIDSGVAGRAPRRSRGGRKRAVSYRAGAARVGA